MLSCMVRPARRGRLAGWHALAVCIGCAMLSIRADSRVGSITFQPDDIAGQLLVATTVLSDPRFVQTVIYMYRHDARGAAGIVVNLPLRQPSLATLFEEWGIEKVGRPDAAVYQGGPVEGGRPFVVHTDDYTFDGTSAAESGIGVTASIDALRAIGAGKRPRHFLVALGRAGWAPRQLERELAADVWTVVQADEDLVFNLDDDEKWDRAIVKGTRPSVYARR